MSIRVSLTRDGIGAVYVSSETLTGQDLLDADAELRSEVARNPNIQYLVIDHSAIPEVDIDTETLRRLARRVGDFFESIPEGHVAIIAPNEILFGLSRMWAARADHPALTTHVVRTRSDAVTWLESELGQVLKPEPATVIR